MDEQNLYQPQDQTPVDYHSPGRSDILLPGRPANPYTAMQQNDPIPVPQPQQQGSGLFSALPYHEYLAKNVENPWTASDTDLTGKHFDSYVDGPIKTLIKAQLAQGNHSISKDALEDRAASIADAIKIQKRKDVENNLDALKAHLGGLQPKDKQGQPVGQVNPYPGTATEAGAYDLIDNPITRGLAQGGNVLASGIGYIGSKLGVPSLGVNPATGEAYAKEASQLEAPKDAGLAARLAQGAASIVGPAAAAGAAALGGGILAGGAALGIPGAGAVAAQHEASGNPLSAGQVAGLTAVKTIEGMLPLGGKGLSVLKNALTGGTIGVTGDVIEKAITGDKLTPEDLEASGLTTAALSVIFHLPPAAKAKLSDAINTLRGKPTEVSSPGGMDADALAAAATGQKGNIDVSKTVPFTALTPDHLAASKSLAKSAKEIGPEAVQEHYDALAADMSPQEANAFGRQVNADIVAAHGKDAPQIEVPDVTPTEVKPVQEGTTAEQTAVPENQTPFNRTVDETVDNALQQPVTTEVGTKKGQIGTGKNVPITFKNDLDKLAYIYSKTKDEAARTALGLELQQRGVPASELPAYAAKVSDYVKSTANALKHHVLADDIASTQKWHPDYQEGGIVKNVKTEKLPPQNPLSGGKKGPKA